MNMSTVLNRLRFALLIGALLFVLTTLVHGAVEDRIEKGFTVTRQPPGPCVLKSSGGNIRVTLPENAAVDLDAKSNGGPVTTDFSASHNGQPLRTSLKAKLNGGGPTFVAHTSGGSVVISKR